MDVVESTQPDDCWSNSVHPGVAVVAEGGGQRGIFTAGVLDAFLDKQFNPFELGIGVSAGAQNLLSYFLGERGYAKRVIEELTLAPDFFVPYRWLGRRSMLDLDQYFDKTITDPNYRLPYKRINTVQQQRRLIFVATDKDTMQPVYLDPDGKTVLTYLKASSALPLLYNEPIVVGEQRLIDGGVADPLPILKAIEIGAKYIVVIRTLSEETFKSSWIQQIDSKRLRGALPESVALMLDTHKQANIRAVEAIQLPPKGVSIVNIAPTKPLQSSALGSSSADIVEDYEDGKRIGLEAVDRLQQWLPKQKQKNLRTLND